MRPDTSVKTILNWLRAVAQGSTLLCVMMIGLVWLGVDFYLKVEYGDAERAAVQNSANLARAFEEHLSRTLNEIDRSLKIIRSNYLLDQDRFDLRRWLSISQLFDDHTLQVAIIDADGFIKLSSINSPGAVGTDLRDREHFRRFINASDDELFISRPVIGRTTEKASVQLARRITNLDGSFAGVIDASLDPNYLSRFYSSVDVGNEGYIRIVGLDGIIRAIGGYSSYALGTDLSNADLLKNAAKQPLGWYYTNSTFTDQIPRLVTYRSIKGYPLIVTIGLSTAELFSGVYAKQESYDFIAVALTLIILAVNGFSVKGRFLRERMAEALKVQNLRLHDLAHHDALTGLLNRAAFAERLDSQLALGGTEKLAVLFLDLDRFKYVNDTLGHLIGDELLKVVAERLHSCIRDADIVARLGGDEFAIICTNVQDKEEVAGLAERICVAIKEPYDLGGMQAVVDVSIGISCAPDDARASDELMKQGDVALYRAKADGRGVYRFFETEMVSRIKAHRKLEVDLRRSLVNGHFELLYQPIVNICDNRVVGLESLLRWRHPERGLILPAEFIPVADETGLIVALGEWVLRQACADAAKWPSEIKIAVNLSPTQFRSRNLAQVVINALAASGVSPRRVELEITEEVLLGHNQENLAVLQQLRNLGIQIVMDDFGVGYSSLNYLRLFPFDRIKIDRSFVNDLSSGNKLSFAIVQAVTTLARALDIPSTAEGIETRDQLELVRAAGFTEFQGYLFSKPRPAAEVSRLLQLNTQVAVSAA
jgi:diguanylate cyclase (GGDEF)-like protein